MLYVYADEVARGKSSLWRAIGWGGTVMMTGRTSSRGSAALMALDNSHACDIPLK